MEITEFNEDVFRKVGNMAARSQVLQAIINTALDNMVLVESGLSEMKDNGRAVLLIIKAFFDEEYDFREAQLERENEAMLSRAMEANESAKGVADHIKRHIDYAVSTQEGE